MKSAEEIILQILLLKAHLENAGVYDEVVAAMKAYASQAIDRCAEEAKTKRVANTGSFTDAAVSQQSILNVKSELK